MSKNVLPIFSSMSFIVSGLTFRSLIYFEFIFLYGVRNCSNFIHVAVQFSQHHLLKRLSLPHCIFFPPFLKIKIPILPRKCSGHSKHPLPITQEKTLHMDITRWSTPKSDWLYSLQPKMEKLYTVNKNKTRRWLWLRSWTPYCQIQT